MRHEKLQLHLGGSGGLLRTRGRSPQRVNLRGLDGEERPADRRTPGRSASGTREEGEDQVAIICWLIIGIICDFLVCWVWRLSFKDKEPITVGKIFCPIMGALLFPLTLFGAMIWFCLWAFDAFSQENCEYTVKWPNWWLRFRYRQHKIVRKLWYLGHPPENEDIFSGWIRYKPPTQE